MHKDWNAIYQEQGVIQKEPSTTVISAISHFKTKGLSTILDLGCGTGRHSTLLFDHGFDVYGCDASEEALRMVSSCIPNADFRQCDMSALPYDNGFFDGILCNQVIQHGLLADIQKACNEMQRVLRPGGHLFLAVVSTQHQKCSTGEEIEPNTRINTDALDGHMPHHFFTADELQTLFPAMEIYKLDHIFTPSALDPEKESAAWELYAHKKSNS